MQIVINGAGAAGIAVCQLLMNYRFKNFIVCTKEDIYEGRPENMNPFKNKIVELTNRDKIKGTLADVLKYLFFALNHIENYNKVAQYF